VQPEPQDGIDYQRQDDEEGSLDVAGEGGDREKYTAENCRLQIADCRLQIA
jgi:hypothetical protein